MHPKISFVIAGRNDNFGERYLERVQACVNSIITFGNKHSLSFELIFVEWNPPANQPHIKNAIKWPSETKPNQVTIIEVPNEIHMQYKNHERIHFFEFPAKNIGIRRAKGEYILATNSDIIFSEEMIKYLATNKLAPNIFCRADRYDIKEPIPSGLSPEKQIEFAESHLWRAQTITGPKILSRKDRLREAVIERAKRINFKKIMEKTMHLVVKISPNKGKSAGIAFVGDLKDLRGLYLNCGGDFFMMHRNEWSRFRGYPEVGIDRGIDCYMTILSHIGGLLQVLLPQPIYHQEHDRSLQYLRPTAILENTPQYLEMLKIRNPVLVNTENWGMEGKRLKEEKIVI